MDSSYRLSPQQRQENISRNQFKELLEQYEWVSVDISPDLGEDFLIQIYENGISTGLSFYIQLKSTEDIKKHLLKSGEITYTFNVKDLEHWENQSIPVFLCLWDITKRQGWWIWINHAIKYLNKYNPEWKRKKKVNIHIQKENEINQKGLQRIRFIIADFHYPIFSQGKELVIQAEFEFPNTTEGNKKREEFENHIYKGAPIELTGNYIPEFNFPEWWNNKFGKQDPREIYLKLGLPKSSEIIVVKIEFSSPNLKTEILPYIELRTIKQGTQETTISNEHQELPLKITLILKKELKQYSISINFNFYNIGIDKAISLLNIQRICSKGGIMKINILKTGELENFPIPKNSIEAPDPILEKFFEEVFFIQNELGIKFCFPSLKELTYQDFKTAEEIVSIIKFGTNQDRNIIFNLNVGKPGIEILIKDIKGNPSVIIERTSEESFFELFSQKIELGPLTQKFSGQLATSISEIKNWLQDAKDEDSMELKCINGEVHEEYENWPR